MNTSASNGCPVCGAKSVSRSHVCPPSWLASSPQIDRGSERVFAVDPYAAAENFASLCEVLAGRLTVDVRKPTGGDPIRIEVEVELVPEYRAVRATSGHTRRS